MVGVPLWHWLIWIDGRRFACEVIEWIFLIFEIFLRPILIVFGLIASVSISFARWQLSLTRSSIWLFYNVGGPNMSPVTCGTPDAGDVMDMVRGVD